MLFSRKRCRGYMYSTRQKNINKIVKYRTHDMKRQCSATMFHSIPFGFVSFRFVSFCSATSSVVSYCTSQDNHSEGAKAITSLVPRSQDTHPMLQRPQLRYAKLEKAVLYLPQWQFNMPVDSTTSCVEGPYTDSK